jgi:hypothetical protein
MRRIYHALALVVSILVAGVASASLSVPVESRATTIQDTGTWRAMVL